MPSNGGLTLYTRMTIIVVMNIGTVNYERRVAYFDFTINLYDYFLSKGTF